MSVLQSNLAAPRYGYDFVVATTQASINSVMKRFLATLAEPVVTVCYVADGRGNPAPVGYEELLRETKGTDPFQIPAGANPNTDPSLRKLVQARFILAFRAQIGLPPGIPPKDLPDLVELGSDTASVKFNLLCSTFDVVELDPGGSYSQPFWMKESQPASAPWMFTSKVDLRLSTVDRAAYSELPEPVQRQIKNLGDSAFSIQQLLFDLDNAALESIPTISGVKPGSRLYTALQRSFAGAYFAALQSGGQPLLGCAITRSGAPAASLVMTDLNIRVCPFLEASGQPVADPTMDQRRLATLNYLCAVDGHALPAAETFAWNWVEANEESDSHGVISINRTAFVNYLRTRLKQYVSSNCYLPKVRVWLTYPYGFIPTPTVHYEESLIPGQNLVVTTPESGPEVLTFHHQAEARDGAGLGDDMGKEILSTSFDLRVNCRGNTMTLVQHLVIYLWVRSLQTAAGGNIVDLTLTDKYVLDCDESGKVVITSESSREDRSKNPHVDAFLDFWTGVNHIARDIENWVRDFVSPNLTDVPLSVVQDYVFPGGSTFAFNRVAFSDHGDLTAHITYARPA